MAKTKLAICQKCWGTGQVHGSEGSSLSRSCEDCHGIGYVRVPVTNADRIRANVATDGGLADCLLALDVQLAEDGKEFTHLYCHGDNGCVDENEDIICNAEMRKACILRWLQQPAEGELLWRQ